MSVWIGIDIGGTRIKGAAVRSDGEIVSELSTATEDDRTDAFVGRVEGLIQSLELAAGPAGALGIAAPGLASLDGRRISWMAGRLDGLMGLDWPSRLNRPASVANDAHAALAGEAFLGAAKGRQNVVMLTLGTGVGGAVLADGRILRGAIGRAGHLGHISLDPDGLPDIVLTPGSLEDAIGECTLAARTGGRFSRSLDLLQAAESGDKEAAIAWHRSIRRLAAGIAGLINCFDPELVVLGGGVAEAGARLLGPLGQYLDLMEWRPLGERVPIVRAELGSRAGAIGAAWLAGGAQ